MTLKALVKKCSLLSSGPRGARQAASVHTGAEPSREGKFTCRTTVEVAQESKGEAVSVVSNMGALTRVSVKKTTVLTYVRLLEGAVNRNKRRKRLGKESESEEVKNDGI